MKHLDNYREMESTYSVAFFPHMLSRTKKREILRMAKKINVLRNELSEIVQGDLLKFLNMSKFEFFNYFNPILSGRISSHFIKKIMEDVHEAYQRRSEAIDKHIQFELVTSLEPVFYKRRTKEKQVGDLKSITRKTKKTNLTITLTYLARYGHTGTMQFLRGAIENTEVKEDKKWFYLKMLDIIERYGFGRLMTLALSKREQVYSRYEDRGAICFSSLSFKGRSRITRPIVARSSKKNSRISHFVELSWEWSETKGKRKKSDTMCIPVKYNAKYHRNLKRYSNGTDTSYTLVVRGKDIHIVLTRDGKRYVPLTEIEQEKVVGADVNQKHNMLSCSDGFTVDHNRELIDDLQKELLKIDKNREAFDKKQKLIIEAKKREARDSGTKYTKQKKVAYKPTRKELRIIDALSRKNTHYQEQKIAEILNHMVASGFNHIVLEDLDGFIGAKTYGDTEGGVNTGRLGKALQLSSIKDIILHMAPRYCISVSLVHKEYSSKQCPLCDCIDDLNRTSQEKFVCVSCGYSDNADHNSSVNLKIRLTSTVLRGKLLMQQTTGYSAFLPKNLPRWKVKDALEKYRHGMDLDPFGNLIEPTVVRNDHCEVLLGLQ
jgi:transposase